MHAAHVDVSKSALYYTGPCARELVGPLSIHVARTCGCRATPRTRKRNAPRVGRGVSTGPRSSHRAATGPELPRPTPGAGSLDRGAHRACRAHRARSAHPQRTQAAAARLRGVSGGRRSTHRQTRLGSGSGSGPGGFGCGLGLPSSPCASQGSPSSCACGPSRAVPHRAPCIEVASCEWQVAGSK